MTSCVRFLLRLVPCLGMVGACSILPAFAADSTGSLPGYEVVRLGRGPGNQLCLAATVGGKKGLLMVDTGANGTVLTDSTYGFLKDRNDERFRNLPKRAGFNWTTVQVTVAPDFTVGEANLGTLPVRLVPGRFLYEQSMIRSEESDRSYDGLLGEEILRHYNAVVDCGRMALYLNTIPSKKLSLSAAFVRAGWTAIPMENIGRDFAVACSYHGQPLRLIVDTGAPFTTVSRGIADTLHMDARSVNGLKMGLVATRAEEIGMATVEGLRVGAYTIPSMHIVVSHQRYEEFEGPHRQTSGGPLAGFLGGDALAANGAIVDVGNGTLFLRQHGGTP